MKTSVRMTPIEPGYVGVLGYVVAGKAMVLLDTPMLSPFAKNSAYRIVLLDSVQFTCR